MDGRTVLAGNEKLMKQNGVAFEACYSVGTVVYVAVDGVYAGAVVIADTIKESAADAIRELKRVGVRKTVMLTGDRKEVGEAVAAQLGLDEVHAQLLPEDKVEQVEQLLTRQRKGESWPLWATESTTRRCSAGRISESPWAAWARTRPSRRRMWY